MRDAGIQSIEDYYSEYSRNALYAFEALLKETENSLKMPINWKPIDIQKRDWLYSGTSEEDRERGCIGHLRGDFGSSGTEFWTTWFDHQPGLNRQCFRQELQDIVYDLRKEGGLLQDFSSMRMLCREGLAVDDCFGFKAESKNYQYCLRCMPRRGDYNFYLYAYDKHAQLEHTREETTTGPARPQPNKLKSKKTEMEL